MPLIMLKNSRMSFQYAKGVMMDDYGERNLALSEIIDQLDPLAVLIVWFRWLAGIAPAG